MSLIIDTSDLIGKPFCWGGRGPDAYDCFGICKEVANRAGLLYPDVPVNGRTSDEATTTFKSVFKAIETGEGSWTKINVIGLPQPLTTVLMKIKGRWHMGITLSNYGDFIHCVEKHKVSMTTISNPLWKPCIEGYYVYTT